MPDDNPSAFARSKTALGWWALLALVLQEGISFQVVKTLLDGPEGDLSDLVDVTEVALITLPFTAVSAFWFYLGYAQKIVASAVTIMWIAFTLATAGALSNMASELPEAVVYVQGIDSVTVTGPSSLQDVLACYLQSYGVVLLVLAAGAAAFFGYVAAVWNDVI